MPFQVRESHFCLKKAIGSRAGEAVEKKKHDWREELKAEKNDHENGTQDVAMAEISDNLETSEGMDEDEREQESDEEDANRMGADEVTEPSFWVRACMFISFPIATHQ